MDCTGIMWGMTLLVQPQGSYSAIPFLFTGELMDGDWLYLRARYYNPGMGVFPSLDPFEGMHSRPMSLNGYLYVEGNVNNATDPSGEAIVNVWIAAFISPSNIVFPYPYGNIANPRGVDLNAVWHGDGRGFYGSGNYPQQDSRVWYLVEFDTDDLTNFRVGRGVNPTSVQYTNNQGNTQTVSGTAPPPKPAQFSLTPGNVRVSISESAANPLISVSPAIDLSYELEFDLCTGAFTYSYEHDVFPWHEMVLSINNNPTLLHHAVPAGPTQTPADLALDGYRYRGGNTVLVTGLISGKSCSNLWLNPVVNRELRKRNIAI